MKISRKAYYGLRAVVVLAQERRQMSIHALAEAEGLPEDYLEKILQDLRRAGLVEATKGQGGGSRTWAHHCKPHLEDTRRRARALSLFDRERRLFRREQLRYKRCLEKAQHDTRRHA